MTMSVIIADETESISGKYDAVICWKSYEKGENVFSVPAYLEQNDLRLRNKYLEFIHDLGEKNIAKKSIIEHLSIYSGFSLWWMSQVSEKSPFKSPRVYDCLRLFALEEIINDLNVNAVHLICSDKVTISSFSDLFEKLDVSYTIEKNIKSKLTLSLLKCYRMLPHMLQGLLSIRHLISKWSFKKLKKPEWFSSNNIFMCSYFYHMDTKAGADGVFYSRQWEELPDFLRINDKRTNWLHHYLSTPGMPDKKDSISWLESFNKDAENQGAHSFVETYITIGIIKNVFIMWVKLNYIAWKLRNVKPVFTAKNTNINLWHFLKNDWKTSLIGSSSITNCLWVELFDAALKDMPYHKKGLYLWENQGWEAALIFAWKKHGHGEIIGVPHSTVRFWALNNFDDIRVIEDNKYLRKPIPNYLAVNGNQAWQEFIKAGYPVDRMRKVEALRYQYLLASCNNESIERSEKYSSNPDKLKSLKMLIIGDFSTDQTYKMIRCVEEATAQSGKDIIVSLKPHPSCPVDKNLFPNLDFAITYEPLNDILNDFDVAFSSNTTSGGLDAVLYGVRTIVYLDDSDFNHSPARGVDGVRFVANSEELIESLVSTNEHFITYNVSDFFWLNKELPLWKDMLIDG